MLSRLRQRFRTWLFRPQIDVGTVTLVQRRIFIIPTRQGFALAGVLVLMLLGDINYALSLGYVLTFLLGMVAVLSMLYAFRNLVRLQVRAGRAEPVFCGEAAAFELVFHNSGQTARYRLRLRADDGTAQVFDLPPGQETPVTLFLPTQQRGWRSGGRLTLATEFPLGLFYAWSYLHFEQRCLVYPSPAERGSLPHSLAPSPDGRLQGQDEEEFAGLRAYQAGDRLSRVAWKQLAREQGLQVKQFTSPAGEALLFDLGLLPPLPLERQLSILTRCVLDAEQQGVRYGLRLAGQETDLGLGPAQRADCLQRLALFALAGGAHE